MVKKITLNKPWEQFVNESVEGAEGNNLDDPMLRTDHIKLDFEGWLDYAGFDAEAMSEDELREQFRIWLK